MQTHKHLFAVYIQDSCQRLRMINSLQINNITERSTHNITTSSKMNQYHNLNYSNGSSPNPNDELKRRLSTRLLAFKWTILGCSIVSILNSLVMLDTSFRSHDDYLSFIGITVVFVLFDITLLVSCITELSQHVERYWSKTFHPLLMVLHCCVIGGAYLFTSSENPTHITRFNIIYLTRVILCLIVCIVSFFARLASVALNLKLQIFETLCWFGIGCLI
eukprot:TRINITY_DN1255_c0_g2_i3.p1 TRINITY_DN1255_c0_g2~~TRINITY_DN1255_c0_g2_i3.p1  ORF type:complete len:219 (+),score=14.75 TRINITY_DN1255_c0_g2_i3:403-1059(+)